MGPVDSSNVGRTEIKPDFRPGMPGYVLRDWEVIDYECYELPGTGLWFRGPPPGRLENGGYFTVIGAAQTFGCFCEAPYPALLEKRLGLPALNLGYSGAGPRFYTGRKELLRFVNGGAFCIVQVMSGRSTSNALFDNPDGLAHGRRASDGQPATADQIFGQAIRQEMARIPLLPHKAKAALYKFLPLEMPNVRRLVEESQQDWLDGYEALLSKIEVPKVLFWFSERRPDYRQRYHSHGGLFGKYPQLVDANMVNRIRPHADAYVECVSTRGLPQPLISRFTGKPTAVALDTDKKPVPGEKAGASLYSGVWRQNKYYPSPEMQKDAANALEKPVRRLMTGF